jgi:hypothetical protein
MGSIGIISLTTRRNRRFFISAEHYPVVKVRPTEVDLDDRCDSIVPSDPLVGGLPAGGRTRIRGSMAGPNGDPLDLSLPRVIPRPSIVAATLAQGMVETRRLELLTLSLQRRRSAN